MHSIFIGTLLASTAALVAAAPAAYPQPTVTCASGQVPLLAHYDDLPAATGRAHAINPSPTPTPGVYQKLYYGNVNWYLTSQGYQEVPWLNRPKDVEVAGNMTAHSGINAIINQENVPLSISTYYGGDYYNLDSFWTRSLSGAAFQLQIRCFVLNGQGSTTAQEIDVAVPAAGSANGGYTKIQLSSAQKAQVAKASSCLFGDKQQITYTLIDDLQYCYYRNPSAPF